MARANSSEASRAGAARATGRTSRGRSIQERTNATVQPAPGGVQPDRGSHRSHAGRGRWYARSMTWSAIAALLLALAVMLGAFGAHGLRDRLDAYSMEVYQKAVFYHFVHALGLLVVSLAPRTSNLVWVQLLLAAGILIF